MRIIFAGTPEISAAVLKCLIAKQHNIVAVLTQPDRPSGRGLKLTPSPVKSLAQQHNIAVLQPQSLKDADVLKELRDIDSDLMIVLAYGLILPQTVLEIPKQGCINIHASLLPRWRGAAPIQHAIMSGDEQTGITIMQMDMGMDTGDMLATYPCTIASDDTSATLLYTLTDLAQTAILDSLHKLRAKELHATPQDNEAATYAPKIAKHDALINWKLDAFQIDRLVRAYNPWPVAFTQLGDQTIRVWRAKLLPELKPYIKAQPGTIVDIDDEGIVVATGNGAIRLLTLQFPGKKPLPANDVIHAHPEISINAIFT